MSRSCLDGHDVAGAGADCADRSRDIGALIRDRRRVVADVLVVAGGGGLLVSAFVHWVSSGYGSGLRGHALIDAVVAVGRNFPGLSVARLTVVWYLVPALGAMTWIAAGLSGAGSVATRFVAVCAAIAALLSVLAIVRLVGFGHLGAGAWLALGGAASAVVGSWAVAAR